MNFRAKDTSQRYNDITFDSESVTWCSKGKYYSKIHWLFVLEYVLKSNIAGVCARVYVLQSSIAGVCARVCAEGRKWWWVISTNTYCMLCKQYWNYLWVLFKSKHDLCKFYFFLRFSFWLLNTQCHSVLYMKNGQTCIM